MSTETDKLPADSSLAANSSEASPVTPPSSGAPVEPTADAESSQSPGGGGQTATQPARPGAPRVKIGTQRPGSGKVRAKPQIASVGATPLPPPASKVQPPNMRHELSPELQIELETALGGMSLDDIVGGRTVPANEGDLQPESRQQGRVISVHREDVFIDLGGRNQGVLSVKEFPAAPAPGTVVEVMVNRLDPEDGLYTLSMPNSAVDVGGWSELNEGMLVSARITGHNKGGLECEVNHLRGFIPAGQVALYRVEDFSQFVDQKLNCIVTEVNPEKRNLVLSRRAVLEREQSEAKEQTLKELAVGQIRDGVVRSIRDFGAFVDLGGVDGLLHVSQLSWARVKHPSELLTEGQTVKVKIQKIDPETGKISLAMKDLTENPWANVAMKYPVRSRVEGTVTKIMDFGAFVQLEPGIEGLVHISELAHQRVWRTQDVVSEGQQVEAQVVSVDPEKQRIGLSMKAIQAKPMPKQTEPQPEEADDAPPPPRKSTAHLKGGMGRESGGEQFGLKW